MADERDDAAAEVPDARLYGGYRDLARAQRRGLDYEITVVRRPSSRVAIIAPHGGGIEDGTSEFARRLAGEDFNLYLFEGLRPSHNYRALHLTSHRFDEPLCLRLLVDMDSVVAVHGCDGAEATVLLGGRDTQLRDPLALALEAAGVAAASSGHRFPATNPANICNRGASGRGVQLELPHSLRRPPSGEVIAEVVRTTLCRQVARTGTG